MPYFFKLSEEFLKFLTKEHFSTLKLHLWYTFYATFCYLILLHSSTKFPRFPKNPLIEHSITTKISQVKNVRVTGTLQLRFQT
jgi:hypothetical protein